MSIWPASRAERLNFGLICFPRTYKLMTAPPPRMLACAVICIGLALPGQTWAEETATGIVSQTDTATRDRSAALRRVVALRQELQVLVKALARLVAYQKELLALAKTSDVDAVLRARRARQTCLEEINAAALCDALSVSFTDDPTMDGADRGNE